MTANPNADFEQSARSASSISGAIRVSQRAAGSGSRELEPRIADLARSPKIAVRDVISGSISALVTISYSLSFAAMIFSGPLKGHLEDGVCGRSGVAARRAHGDGVRSVHALARGGRHLRRFYPRRAREAQNPPSRHPSHHAVAGGCVRGADKQSKRRPTMKLLKLKQTDAVAPVLNLVPNLTHSPTGLEGKIEWRTA